MLRSEGSSSTASRSFSSRRDRLVEAPPGQDVGQPGGVDARALGPRVLGQVAERALAHDGAAGRAVSPPRTLSRLVLPAPLRPDQADLVAGAHGEGRLDQGEAAADLHAQVPGLQHPSMMTGGCR